jgi:mono/diheme cytochrome c family protein
VIGLGAGPCDKQEVNAAAADRGRNLYATECVNCHGALARGTDLGANLVRSLVVLHDRVGSELGPFLKKGHKTQSGKSSASFTEAQIADLSHFLKQRVNDALRGSPLFQPNNVLVGDAKAGEAYFRGEGKCAGCHSPTGDLAGIAGRMSPIQLQQRFVFPSGGGRGRGGPAAATARRTVTATVTPASGTAVTGAIVMLDDFFVTIRDSSGELHTWKRTPAVKVVKNDPFQAHIELLDKISDKNMHDVTAYLETLK